MPNFYFSFTPFGLRGPLVGGAAGCVIAGRLAAADSSLRILILEAGPPTFNNPAHTQPARFISHLAPGSRTVRVHNSRPSAALGGRSAAVPCGQCLGGGGSVNCTFLHVLQGKHRRESLMLPADVYFTPVRSVDSYDVHPCKRLRLR